MKRVLFVIAILAAMYAPVQAQTEDQNGEKLEMLIPDGDGYITVEGVRIKVTDPFHVRQTHFKNNWYIGLQAGAYQSWGSFTSHTNFLDKIGPAAAFVVGKEITPISEIRAQLLYGRGQGQLYPNDMKAGVPNRVYHWNNTALYLSYMPNITNLLFGYKEGRWVNVKGMVGIGLEQSWKASEWAQPYLDGRHTLFAHSLVALQAGVNLGFRIKDNFYLTLEATENFLDDCYDRNIQQPDHTWDGHLNLLLGFTYHLGKDHASRHFVHVENTLTTLTEKQDTLNDLRNRNNYLARNPKHITKTIKTDAEVIFTLIAFDNGSSFVDRMQQTNIYNTAAIWERRQDSKIFITTENKTDNALYRDRVDAIKHVLKDRYNIPDEQIVACPNENDIDKLMQGKTAIVFVINQ